MNTFNGEQDAELKAHFDEHGYVSLPGYLSAEEVDELNRHIDTFIADVVPTMPRERVFYEDVSDPSTLKQLLRLYEFDETFNKMAFNSRYERLAEVLLGEAVTVENMQWFNKAPKASKPSPTAPATSSVRSKPASPSPALSSTSSPRGWWRGKEYQSLDACCRSPQQHPDAAYPVPPTAAPPPLLGRSSLSSLTYSSTHNHGGISTPKGDGRTANGRE